MRANRYVSYLAAEIEPKALTNISNFEAATEKAFANIEKHSVRNRAAAGFGAVDASSARTLAANGRAMATVRREMDLTDASTRRLAKDNTLLAASLHRTGQALNVVQGPLGPLAGRMSALGGVLRELSGFSLAGVLGGAGAFSLASIASDYAQVTDKLRPFYDTQSQANSAMREVIGIARDTRQALLPVAELYTKITQAGRDAGIDPDRLGRLTTTVAKAAKLSGGDAGTQSAGLTQFSQGFGSGELNGEELKSIKENTFRLAKALADGLDVPIAKLKELGSAGLLTQDLIDKALERSALQIDLEFSRLPKRIGTSLTEAGNNFSIFIGKMDEASGATRGLAEFISALANNIPAVVVAASGLVAALSARAFGESFGKATTGVVSFGKNLVKTVEYQNLVNNAVATGNNLYASAAERASFKAQAQLEATRLEVAGLENVTSQRKIDQAALRQQISLIEQQRKAQQRSLSAAKTLEAAGTSGSSGAVSAAQRDVNATLAARLRTQRILAAVDKELVAAETQLAAAGMRLAAAQGAAGAAIGAIPPAAARAGVALTALTAVKTRLLAAGSSLVGFLGGPWGVAFTAAAVAASYLATRVSAAKTALDNFSGGQEALAERLGITTAKLREQGAAARQLALDLARAGVAKARQAKIDAGGELAGKLFQATTSLPSLFANDQQKKDRAKLLDLTRKARSGQFDYNRDYAELSKIQERNPSAFKGDFIQRIFGTNPDDIAETTMGVAAATFQLADAEKELADVRKQLDAPRSPAPVIPKTRTKSQLIAAGDAAAATSDLAKARAALKQIRMEGRGENETEQEFIDRYAAAKRGVDALAASTRKGKTATDGAAKAARAHAAALKRQDVAAEGARDKADKLANIMSRFTDEPPLIKQAQAAKRALEDLFTENKGGKLFKDEGSISKYGAQIDAFLRKPLEDAQLESERMRQVQEQILAGREDEAAVLRESYEMLRAMGELSDDDIERIRTRLSRERELNDELEKRSALVEEYAQQAGDAQRIFRDGLRQGLAGDPLGGAKNILKGLYNRFLDGLADQMSRNLFGDAEQQARDAMTRSLDSSANNLVTSADLLGKSAHALDQAAQALSNAATAGAAPSNVLTGAIGEGTPEGAVAAAGQAMLTSATGASAAAKLANKVVANINSGEPANQDQGVSVEAQAKDVIQVVGKRLPKDETLPANITEAWNKAGKTIGTKIFGQNSPITQVLGKIGTGLQGSAEGQAASGVLRSLGVKQSKTGAAIGGAIGSFLPIPGGSIIGGIIGGTIGGLLKKTKTGSATINSVDGDATLSGSSGAYKKEAEGLAGNVQSSLSRISDLLNGSVGDFSVSIGKRNKKFVVDPTGQGRTKGAGVLKFEDEAAAINAAILDALQDGAIKGIREGSKRLLAAGKDLDKQLEKALKFENVFRRLKAKEDPIGFAVEEVNREFEGLIRVFKEAGASAAEYADLERLYGYERAAAIEQATQGSIEALQKYIDEAIGGKDSPLDRRTVYANAKAALDPLAADVTAGKIVDQQKLLEAVDNFDNASRELFGSRSAYFTDFDAMLALVTKARDNVSNSTGAGSTLPASPFTDEFRKSIEAQTSATNTQTGILADIRNLLASGGGSSYTGGDYSALALGLLPGLANR